MAFQQPTALPPPRALPSLSREEDLKSAKPKAEAASPEPQEWILFPTPKPLSHRPRPSISKHTNLSHLSSFGSLNSLPHPDDNASAALFPYETTFGGSVVDEDETDELDSLVDGLHTFQPPFLSGQLSQSGHVFPRHDGLGTFQDQIRQFERHNPLRSQTHQRRPSSVKRKLDELEGDTESNIEVDKRERIEAWRLEHSRILLDEIEKETRRRSTSQTRRSEEMKNGKEEGKDDDIGRASGQDTPVPPSSGHLAEEGRKDATFLDRFTTRIVHNILGLDDTTLSFLFGEALPASTPRTISQPSAFDPLTLLARLAHLLLPAIPPSQPPSQATLSYAGIPVAVTEPTSSRTHPRRHSRSPLPTTTPQHWGIEDGPPSTSAAESYPATLLSVLRLHLLPPSPSPSPSQSNPHHNDPMEPREKRAETIRHLHPLVQPFPRARLHARNLSGRGNGSRLGARRRWGSSCRSQSIRTTTSTTSAGSYSGGGRDGGGSNSRCYWDIGGGMGSWGEV